MMRSRGLIAIRCIQRGGFAIAYLAVFVIVNSHSASATCGSYLLSQGSHLASDSPDLDPFAESPVRAAPPADQPRCSGPNCHRQDPPPLAPGPRLLMLRSNGDALIVQNVRWTELPQPVLRCPSENDVLSLNELADRIYRPPRAH
ncbi:hypothetical protein [Schlesneria sp. DSM 10557]|uniref:hypothetical protein n=1 Tax=Schlesneria sp. DSM 10557 TaxID=3044399 RepID=UPI00359FD00A